MTILYRVGIFLLTAGLLLVGSVFAIWIAAPLSVPSLQQPAQIADEVLAAPALSTLAPSPLPMASGARSLVSEGEGSPLSIPTSTPAVQPSAVVDLNESLFEETRELGAQMHAPSVDFYRLSIPALDIDAPVIPVGEQELLSSGDRDFRQWVVPDAYAAGWHDSSALPGQRGNTVLNGHNNIHGAVFGNLVDLSLGEQILLYNDDHQYIYQVVHREFLPERGETMRIRLRNARWILPSDDTRLTLVTCWPNSSNTHRLVVVAEALTTELGH